MKCEQLSIGERNNVLKYIKESLLSTQKIKTPINPNEFNYEYKKGGLVISGKLKNMSDRQINACVIRNVK